MKKPPEGGLVGAAAGLNVWARAPAAQAEKLEPQPQVVVALGFLITN